MAGLTPDLVEDVTQLLPTQYFYLFSNDRVEKVTPDNLKLFLTLEALEIFENNNGFQFPSGSSIYVQPTAPSDAADGDVWFQTGATGQVDTLWSRRAESWQYLNNPQSDSLSAFLELPTNKSYTIDCKAYISYRLLSIAAKTTSGSCDLALRINQTLVSGSSLQVGNTLTEATLTGGVSGQDNLVALGNEVELIISNTQTAQNLSLTLGILRLPG